jgi:hypothetical protein
MMQYVAFLMPIAFIFAQSALSQVASLKKQIDVLENCGCIANGYAE